MQRVFEPLPAWHTEACQAGRGSAHEQAALAGRPFLTVLIVVVLRQRVYRIAQKLGGAFATGTVVVGNIALVGKIAIG